MRLVIRAVIVLCVVSAVFLITFLPLYYVGWFNNIIWNQHSNETTCVVISQDVITDTCYYQCNPTTTCTEDSKGNEVCTTTYQLCAYTCYDGYFTVGYNTSSGYYTYRYEEYAGENDSQSTWNLLYANYPIGLHIVCYYNTHDPSDVRWQRLNPIGYYIAAVAAATVCLATLVGWLLYEAIIAIKAHSTQIRTIISRMGC